MSYDLDINGNHSTRHRKFIKKLNLPIIKDDDTAVESSSDNSGYNSGAGGGDSGNPGQWAERAWESRAGTAN